MKKGGSKSFNRRMKSAKKIGAELTGNGGCKIIIEHVKFPGFGSPNIIDFRHRLTFKEVSK